MSEEIPEPTDLRTICSTLEHFSLPAALCSIEHDKLVVWNELFRKASGLSEDELAQAGLSSLIFYSMKPTAVWFWKTIEILAIREQEPIAEVWTRLIGETHSEASPRLKEMIRPENR